MAWIILFLAGLTEVGWAVGLKYTEGFTRLVPSVLTVICMAASLGLLGSRSRRCRSAPPTRYGPGLAPSVPRCSESYYSASPRARCGSPASG